MKAHGIERLKIRDFRCIAAAELEFTPGWTYVVGQNAQGKTSLLEAVCVALRLQSPRSRRLGDLVRHESRGLLLDAHASGAHLQFYYGASRRKLALDGVEQRTAEAYLARSHVVFFANSDMALVQDGADGRRRFLDFIGAQRISTYRAIWRSYDRALRSRNRLLKEPRPSARELAAFDIPLLASGGELLRLRAELCAALRPNVEHAYREISGEVGTDFQYLPGDRGNFLAELAASRAEEMRLRQTLVGPHRDDISLKLGGHTAAEFASEGQQRSLALALRIAQVRLLAEDSHAPILLLDDIFGELDPDRRTALLHALPRESQRIVTTTSLDWIPDRRKGRHLAVADGVFAVADE